MEHELTDDEYWRDNWYCETRMGIEETRLMYSWICFSLEMWPGSPKRPIEEQQWLFLMKNRLFAVLMDHQLQQQD